MSFLNMSIPVSQWPTVVFIRCHLLCKEVYLMKTVYALIYGFSTISLGAIWLLYSFNRVIVVSFFFQAHDRSSHRFLDSLTVLVVGSILPKQLYWLGVKFSSLWAMVKPNYHHCKEYTLCDPYRNTGISKMFSSFTLIYLVLFLYFFLICNWKILFIVASLEMKLTELLFTDENYVHYTAIQFHSVKQFILKMLCCGRSIHCGECLTYNSGGRCRTTCVSVQPGLQVKIP